VGEEIPKTSDLCLLFGGDWDGLVTADEERTAPPMESSGFLGEIGIDVAHEASELLSVSGRAEQVEVIG